MNIEFQSVYMVVFSLRKIVWELGTMVTLMISLDEIYNWLDQYRIDMNLSFRY